MTSTAEPVGGIRVGALGAFSCFGVNKHCVNKGQMEIELLLDSSSACTYVWDIQCGPALPISWLKWTKEEGDIKGFYHIAPRICGFMGLSDIFTAISMVDSHLHRFLGCCTLPQQGIA